MSSQQALQIQTIALLLGCSTGGGSMRLFKKFWDYVLQSDNKSKEKVGVDPNLQHLLQPTPELNEVTRCLQVVQGLQR